MSRTPSPERQRGQVLALFVFGALAMVAMVAFVVDGGNAFAQERHTQNGTDAAAIAGATVIAETLGGATRSDADVLLAVTGVATRMGIGIDSAVYTDIDGNPIGVTVGLQGTSAPPSTAAGVAVTGRLPFDTFFARAIGINQLTAVTDATALAGYGQPYRTTFLPVTPPVNILTCDGQNNPAFKLPLEPWAKNQVYQVPLCKNGPGNVGWLDYTPPAGGTSEVVDMILDPSQIPGIDLPSWQFVTSTGNINSKAVEDALRTYDTEVVWVPLFDSTCDTQPSGTEVSGCPPQNVGGNGQNQWYHFPQVAMFQLCGQYADGSYVDGCTRPHGAYVNGNNSAVCDAGGNGATSCLIGKFVDFVGEGRVTGPLTGTPSPSRFIAVQLIG